MEGVQCHKKAREIQHFYGNLTSIFCYRDDGSTEGISSEQIEVQLYQDAKQPLELSLDGQNWTMFLRKRPIKMRSSNSTYLVRRRPKLVQLPSTASASKRGNIIIEKFNGMNMTPMMNFKVAAGETSKDSSLQPVSRNIQQKFSRFCCIYYTQPQ